MVRQYKGNIIELTKYTYKGNERRQETIHSQNNGEHER